MQRCSSVAEYARSAQLAIAAGLEIPAGGDVRFTLGAQAPEQGWGTAQADLPVSYCATPGSAQP